MPNESELTALVRDVTIFHPGAEAKVAPAASYLGGTPFAPSGTAWPNAMTCLGRFGFAADSWAPGNARWITVFLNEGEGYVEWGDPDHVTIWSHGAGEDFGPIDPPDNVRVVPARALVQASGKELPYDKRLGDWQSDAQIDGLRRQLTNNDGGHCQLGGYPTVYGGFESLGLMEDPGSYELVLKLNRYPLVKAGFDVEIHDVLNVYFHPESGEFYAEMQR
ncbi:hypothetical protein ENSA5_15560 [Enhygromyxa salina]|uniref:Uncharacterized protein n=1 Tax=Enhygromyxa salina TaxID=215803 RepID=A0A2S9YEU1_9BACT|nr:hypothetical protein [Enhygromyxa salina]PRQ03526.1 hypothetical protein ENSA5_15560 [Enhygromyxa salina]